MSVRKYAWGWDCYKDMCQAATRQISSVNIFHLVDPELVPMLANQPAADFDRTELPALRVATDRIFEQIGAPFDPPRVVLVPGAAGSPEVQLRIFASRGLRPKPAIYSIHGGGFVLGSAAAHDGIHWRLAEHIDADVIAVDYRLAPETPFPGPLEDCYAGLRWLFANADSLGVDPKRIVISGSSAGGGLAAALALLAHDRNDVQPAGLMLAYPMLDHRTGTADDPYINPTVGQLGWTAEHNRFGWSAMRGNYQLDDDRRAYFSPMLADGLGVLPPTFIAVGSLDLFLEEDVAFALRVSRAGVPMECHVYPGAVHGFDLLGDTSLGRQFRHDQREALRRWFRR